jgi:competence protein ComEC
MLFGLLSHVMIVLSGYAMLLFHNDQYDLDHLLHQRQVSAYKVEVIDQPVDKEKSIRVLGKVIAVKDSICWKATSGKMYLYLSKDDRLAKVSYGDVLLVKGSPGRVHRPKNPGEFDYQRYLRHQNIYHQDFVKVKEFTIADRQLGNSLYAFAIRSRIYFKEIIYAQIIAHRERAIALALLLGTKEALTSEIREIYAAAGAMHILAVSGLHVGIIYGLILLLFRNAYKRPVMKWVFLVVALGGLWSYALITGLSASVLRAVTMFSLMTIAKVARREGNIYNTLSAAGLLLLGYDPSIIMSVGFQLSFLAVFGIVYITPKIYHMVMVDQYLLNKMWEATCVTLAAQISTLPLVLLYFHQFPTYFFLANLVVIPAAFAILISGLMLFVVAVIPYAREVVGFVLDQLIYWTNEFVYLMDGVPNNTIDDLYIDPTQAWLMIAGIVLLFACYHYRRLVYLTYSLLTMVLFILIQQDRNMGNLQRKEIVFYSISQHTAIDFMQGDQAVLISDSLLLKNQRTVRYHIKPKRLMAGIAGIPKEAEGELVRRSIGGNELIVWNARRVLIMRELPSQLMRMQVDVLVIANNSVYSLSQLDTLDFGTLIIDGSNSRYRTDRLMTEAVGKKYKAIDLIGSGAYAINLCDEKVSIAC